MAVVILGNSGDLLQRRNGKFIDEAEHIIRLNSFRLAGVEEFVGNRIDIVAINIAPDVVKGALVHSAELIRQATQIWTPQKRDPRILGLCAAAAATLGFEPGRILTATDLGAPDAIDVAHQRGQEAFDGFRARGDAHALECGPEFRPTTGFVLIHVARAVFPDRELCLTGFGLNSPLSTDRFDTSGQPMWRMHHLPSERAVLLDGVERGLWRAI